MKTDCIIAVSVVLVCSISYIIWIILGLSVRVPNEIMLYDFFWSNMNQNTCSPFIGYLQETKEKISPKFSLGSEPMSLLSKGLLTGAWAIQRQLNQ